MFVLSISRPSWIWVLSGQKLGHQVKSVEILVYTVEVTFATWFWWNLVRMFVFTISRPSLNMGHVGSKTRSPGPGCQLVLLFPTFSYFSYFLAHLSTKCSVSFCDPSMSGVRRPCVCASVNNFFKQHLLWNRLLDFDQTLQEWSLGGPLSKLFKPFQLAA